MAAALGFVLGILAIMAFMFVPVLWMVDWDTAAIVPWYGVAWMVFAMVVGATLFCWAIGPD